MVALTAYTALNGRTMTVQQQLNLKIAINTIIINEKLSHGTLQYWGMIEGIHADYIILQYQNIHKAHIQNTYYYSIDNGVNFTKITSKLDSFIETECRSVRVQTALFTGQPLHTYRVTEYEDEEQEEQDDDETELKPKTRYLNEIERLLYVVGDIDTECHITVRGSYHMSVNGSISKSKQPINVPIQQLTDLSQYQLVRDPLLDITHSKVRSAGVSVHSEFLDTLSDVTQTPEKNGLWCIQASEDKLGVTIRNLQYPGYEYHGECSVADGFTGVGCYVGNGLKLNEIHFLL